MKNWLQAVDAEMHGEGALNQGTAAPKFAGCVRAVLAS